MDQRPTFSVHVETVAGVPHIISMEPETPPGGRVGPEIITYIVASTLRMAIEDAVHAYNGWHYSKIRHEVKGILNYITLTNSQRQTKTDVNSVAEIDGKLILTITEGVSESGTPFDIMNTEWRFTIIPATLLLGGSAPGVIPKWAKSFPMTWRNYTDDIGPINCAAFALNWIMNYEVNQYRGDAKRIGRALIEARQLQSRLGWGTMISFPDLKAFTDLYPTKRVSVHQL